MEFEGEVVLVPAISASLRLPLRMAWLEDGMADIIRRHV